MKFSGFGPGKRATWRKRVYRADGSVVDDAPAKSRLSSTKSGKGLRFVPHVNYSLHENDAKALGLKRTKDKGTVLETERQLNNYLARERDLGRDTGWRDF
jgi:hypothetical protein